MQNTQKSRQNQKISIFILTIILLIPAGLFAQTEAANAAASRTAGGTIIYYSVINEAFEAAFLAAEETGYSINNPDEITVLKDIILEEHLYVEDNTHIRLITGNSDVRILRGSGNLEFPLIWVGGVNSSLELGKPNMQGNLFLDGGYPAITAQAPIIAVHGNDAVLVMHDKVTLQNNFNNCDAPPVSLYQNGAGVYLRSDPDGLNNPPVFYMKGGTISGNTNDVQNPIACGGGVFLAGTPRFYMEGGIIMNNSTKVSGGGVHLGSRASFTKTGGIIYGSDAEPGFRNTAREGTSAPKSYGHSVCVAITDKPIFRYRNDTVGENDNLSYEGVIAGTGTFGTDEKWDNPTKALWRRLLIIGLPSLAALAIAFIVILKIAIKKRIAKIEKAKEAAPKFNLDEFGLSPREKEICEHLLTELPLKEIAYTLKISYSGANFHAQNLYRKLGIQSRTELFVMLGGRAVKE